MEFLATPQGDYDLVQLPCCPLRFVQHIQVVDVAKTSGFTNPNVG